MLLHKPLAGKLDTDVTRQTNAILGKSDVVRATGSPILRPTGNPAPNTNLTGVDFLAAELTRIQRGKCHANSLDNFLSLRQPRAANLKCAGARNGLRDLPGLVRAREETPDRSRGPCSFGSIRSRDRMSLRMGRDASRTRSRSLGDLTIRWHLCRHTRLSVRAGS